MLSAPQLQSVLPTLPRVSLTAPWYRAVADDLLQGPPPGVPAGSPPQPLWPGGPARGSRFTPPASAGVRATPVIEALYFAEDELTPFFEITGMIRTPGSPVPLFFPPQVMMTVTGTLAGVLDLADAGVQAALSTNPVELAAPWRLAQSRFLAGTGNMPPTQLLGQEAFNSGAIVGLRYQSSKNPAGFGIVVFTARLVAGTHAVTLHTTPAGRLQQQVP